MSTVIASVNSAYVDLDLLIIHFDIFDAFNPSLLAETTVKVSIFILFFWHGHFPFPWIRRYCCSRCI